MPTGTADSTDFYPRPPRGGRPPFLSASYSYSVFLSTPSARRATHELVGIAAASQFLSTPSARRATEIPYSQYTVKEFLSTPSARRATQNDGNRTGKRHISIHALREEGDLDYMGVPTNIKNFYPRPPRGGRPIMPGSSTRLRHFYPRPPRGGRLDVIPSAA